jgi:hypothetical protein
MLLCNVVMIPKEWKTLLDASCKIVRKLCGQTISLPKNNLRKLKFGTSAVPITEYGNVM